MKVSMSKRALVGGCVWFAVGAMLIYRGLFPHWVNASANSKAGAWLALSAGILLGTAKGIFVLRKTARRMVARIESHPNPAWLWQIYPPAFVVFLPMMIGLGIAVRYLCRDDAPQIVVAVYVGIGAALMASSVSFFMAWKRLGRGAGAASPGENA
jgi:hypothetical protein